MQSLKLSFFALAVMTIGLTSCSKETDVKPNSAENINSAARTIVNGSSIGFYNAPNEEVTSASAIDNITIKGDFPGKNCGKVQLKRQIRNEFNVLVDDPNFVAPANYELDDSGSGEYEFTINHSVSGNGLYFYSAHYVSSGPNCNFTQGFVLQAPIEIKDDCSGFTLAPSKASINGNNISFDIILTNCTGNDVAFKLQGGLIAGASSISVKKEDNSAYTSADGFASSTKNQNTVLTLNSTIRDGETLTLKVTYTYAKTISSGMSFTGNWSAKSPSGNTLGTFAPITAINN